jgi:hypothetical protein
MTLTQLSGFHVAPPGFEFCTINEQPEVSVQTIAPFCLSATKLLRASSNHTQVMIKIHIWRDLARHCLCGAQTRSLILVYFLLEGTVLKVLGQERKADGPVEVLLNQNSSTFFFIDNNDFINVLYAPQILRRPSDMSKGIQRTARQRCSAMAYAYTYV